MESQKLSQPLPEPPPPPPPEQVPLNPEKVERQIDNLEVGAQAETLDEKSKVDEMKEKLKKPTIGIGLIVYLILNTVQFFVGITTTKDCPIQPIIPIYLAVSGALGIVTKIIPIVNRNRRLQIVDRILGVLFIIEFIWMILGSYWIYSIYKPNYRPEEGLYCNKTAYLLAFWLLTINYIFLILLITIPCCILCCGCLLLQFNTTE